MSSGLSTRCTRITLGAVLGAALAYLAVVLARGTGPGADTIFWAPSAGNGFSSDDWPIAVTWLLGLVLGSLLLTPRGMRPCRVAPLSALHLVLTFLALTLVKGDGPDSGPTIFAFSQAYGVNVGDLSVVTAWLAGVLASGTLALRRT